MKILNLENENRKFTKSIENFQRHGISPGFQRLADDCHGGVLHEQNECAPPPGCH